MELQDELLNLALVPRLADAQPGRTSDSAIRLGTELGFISGDEHPELHPLLREFLLDKLAETPSANQRVRDAIDYCTQIGSWDGAIDLLKRFRCDEFVEPVLTQAFKPLAFSGRLETLSSLAALFRVAPSFPPPSIDVIEAESALRDGNFELAPQLAARVRSTLPPITHYIPDPPQSTGTATFSWRALEPPKTRSRRAETPRRTTSTRPKLSMVLLWLGCWVSMVRSRVS